MHKVLSYVVANVLVLAQWSNAQNCLPLIVKYDDDGFPRQ